MGNTTAVGLCNTDDMNVVHAMFRDLLGRAVSLVREVRPGDRDRAAIVVAHVREIAHGLHDHHSTEDTLLWDDLAARAPACALDVGLMRSQHATVADQFAALEDPLTRLERTASAAARDDATEALDRVRVTLGEHLGAEEEQILPWVRTTFTQEEWDVLGKVGRSKIAKERMFVQLGHMMAPMSDDEARAWTRANLPLPARLMYLLVGRRQYLAEVRTLYPEGVPAWGTLTPWRGSPVTTSPASRRGWRRRRSVVG